MVRVQWAGAHGRTAVREGAEAVQGAPRAGVRFTAQVSGTFVKELQFRLHHLAHLSSPPLTYLLFITSPLPLQRRRRTARRVRRTARQVRRTARRVRRTARQVRRTARQVRRTARQVRRTVRRALRTVRRARHTARQVPRTARRALHTARRVLHTVRQVPRTARQVLHTARRRPNRAPLEWLNAYFSQHLNEAEENPRQHRATNIRVL